MEVYKAIAAVQSDLAKIGIAKEKKAGSTVSYAFRGIDAVYAALAPLLATHKLIIIPRVISRDSVDRQTKNGGSLFYVWLKVEFDFVSAEDGSKHTACTYGEAMDTSDKATNKAMSAAYKYAAFMTFAIPTEGDNDADATSHDVAPAKIDDAQVATLITGLEHSRSDTGKFLAHFKIASLADLPASEFNRAYALIQKKMTETGGDT